MKKGKTLEVHLTGNALMQFAEVQYSLHVGDEPATDSQVINHCLEEMYDFENVAGMAISDFIRINYPDYYKRTDS